MFLTFQLLLVQVLHLGDLALPARPLLVVYLLLHLLQSLKYM